MPSASPAIPPSSTPPSTYSGLVSRQREREVHADHERDQAEPGQHAPLEALGQAPAEQHAR